MNEEERKRLEHVASRWREQPPAAISLAEIERYLVEVYRAYEIPTEIIPRADYEADDEVRENEIAKLFTITDPDVLPQLFGEWEQEMWEGVRALDPAALELDRRFLFEVPEEAGFRLMHIEQARGLRVSVLIEARDGVATGFRVYNASALLSSDLCARIGPVSFPTFVDVGNIHDRDFAAYLLDADRLGLV